MHSPVNHVASGMIFLHRYQQALIPPACYESLLASTLSTPYSRGPTTGFLRQSRVKTWRLTVVAPRSLCARPLLIRRPATSRAQGHQGSHEEPPAPAVRRSPSCCSSLRALSDGASGASLSGPSPARGLSACLPVSAPPCMLNTAISHPAPATSVPRTP